MDLQSQFRGCLLGHALGDAIGVPFEGVPADVIGRDFGGARRVLGKLTGIDTLIYSDDTQMMIGVAECLIEDTVIDPDRLMKRFVANYESFRGYGKGARTLIEHTSAGGDWRSLAASIIPGGSYGNGAAMRAAPVGLMFHQDRDRLDEQVTQSAVTTHLHPLGIEGAAIFADAIALAITGATRPFDRARFFADLLSRALDEEFQWQLRTAAKLTENDPIPFGSSLPAHRSVVSAICCFANNSDAYLPAITSAITLGDDTDTVAGMAGALVGTRNGVECLPTQYLERLENGTQGRDYIQSLADRLFNRWQAT